VNKSLFLLSLFLCCSLFSQRANQWLFGFGAGLSFNGGTPTLRYNGSISNYDNSSAVSDLNGNLLFYTDGQKVWDKNNNPMPNGTGLIGNTTAGQCALIVPFPNQAKKYIVFHVTEFANPGYLNYSVVDMSLNGGLGDVIPTQKNVSLGSGWTEKLCAIYNPFGNYYWVLTHKWGNSDFVAFKVDANGVATNSIVTSIGSSHTCGSVGGVHDAMGQLTISSDGSKVANALTCSGTFEVFSFNIQNGSLSNSISIVANGASEPWATAFSANSNLLYLSGIFGDYLYQVNLGNFTAPAVNASLTKLHGNSSTGYAFGYMERGPDDKIYIARPNQNFLAAINAPNNVGLAANFSPTQINLGNMTSSWGLSRLAYDFLANDLPTNFNKQILPQNYLNIYPMPCNDWLFVSGFNPEIHNTHVAIFNAFGALIFSGDFETNYGALTLETRNLAPGIYHLVCSNDTLQGVRLNFIRSPHD
jgi:hypothetical protein